MLTCLHDFLSFFRILADYRFYGNMMYVHGASFCNQIFNICLWGLGLWKYAQFILAFKLFWAAACIHMLMCWCHDYARVKCNSQLSSKAVLKAVFSPSFSLSLLYVKKKKIKKVMMMLLFYRREDFKGPSALFTEWNSASPPSELNYNPYYWMWINE